MNNLDNIKMYGMNVRKTCKLKLMRELWIVSKAVSYAAIVGSHPCVGLQSAAVCSGLPTELFFAFSSLCLECCKTCPYHPSWFCHCVHILQTV